MSDSDICCRLLWDFRVDLAEAEEGDDDEEAQRSTTTTSTTTTRTTNTAAPSNRHGTIKKRWNDFSDHVISKVEFERWFDANGVKEVRSCN